MNRPHQVLIVEDLPDVALWLRACLQTALAPQRIDHADDLAGARRCLGEYRYDLLLLDLGLPDGDGADLIRGFKRDRPQAPCIVTTIFDDAEHLFGCLRAGADGYLLKDDTEAEFTRQLTGILEGRPPLSPSIARRLLQQFRSTPGPDETPLTRRETDLLTLIAKGLSVKHAARQLNISHHTAAGYLKEIYQKLQVNSRAEAALKAVNLGLVNPS